MKATQSRDGEDLGWNLRLDSALPVKIAYSPHFVIMEPSSPKKIQFAVPPLNSHLDPQASEQIRRRRPTPATLQIYTQPEVGDQHDAGGGAQTSHGAQRKQSNLAPPTLKELQLEAEQHPGSSLWTNGNRPEEANGNEAALLLANQERGAAASNSSDVSCDSQNEASSPDSVSR
uniref:protein phosphatase 1 regulatory subunit 1A-like isoform X2 n=1 Tax=Doryrhamphus excisus TaxID=161450 RepID=UPI0025AE2E11|nr:protein phosphatase 1 regulatory subunit 1A-like isoform X2 [Doryrhamphus excisus]